jgi:hypothetical protein
VSIEETNEVQEQAPRERHYRKAFIGLAVAFVAGAVGGLLLNAMVSGPSLEVVEARFEDVTADLDGIAVEGEDGEYDLTHAAGVECLPDAEPGELVRLGVANIDRGDAEVPFVAELGGDRVVLWVECTGLFQGTDL